MKLEFSLSGCLMFCFVHLGILLFCVGFSDGGNQYGAGEVSSSARVFYVSQDGDDSNDGLTKKSAWRSVARGMKSLQKGDVLEIGEGDYEVDSRGARLNWRKSNQVGEPGAPICIRGEKGRKVVLRGSRFFQRSPEKSASSVYRFQVPFSPYKDIVYEYPSQTMLQKVQSEQLVRKFPGTFHIDGSKEMTVHFAAENQTGIYVGKSRYGMCIFSSYTIIENLTFEHYFQALYMLPNPPRKNNKAEHITVRNCNFYHNMRCGIVCGTDWTLISGNRGLNNGSNGTIMTIPGAKNNLITGNWLGVSPLTRRQQSKYDYNYAVSHYGYGGESVNNHIIGNYIENPLALRLKTACPGSRIEDNVFMGNVHVHVTEDQGLVPVFWKRNFLGKKIFYGRLGGSPAQSELEKAGIVFADNVTDMKQFRPRNTGAFEALKLKIERLEQQFPRADIQDIRLPYIGSDRVVITWNTPECDGWGTVFYGEKGKKKRSMETAAQEVNHSICLTGLKAGTDYEYKISHRGRYGGASSTAWKNFQTSRHPEKSGRLTVTPGGMSLSEACCRAVPGDEIVLSPGVYSGSFVVACSGLPGKPIVIRGNKDAVIDAQYFYHPVFQLKDRKNIIIDGLKIKNVYSESEAFQGVFNLRGCSDIVIKNCFVEQKDYPCSPFVYALGKNITIDNNLILGGSYTLRLRGEKFKITRNTIVDSIFCNLYAANVKDIEFTDNIFYRPCISGKTNQGVWLQNVSGSIIADRNLYWSPIKNHPLGGRIVAENGKIIRQSQNLEEWQKIIRQEYHSVQSDPLFMDPEKNDFRLRKNSPLQKAGVNFDEW